MSVHVLDVMAREGFEELHALHDRRSGLRAFLGVHDTVRGPAFGGIRRHEYRDEREALMDCVRLSRAMTRKCALADIPAGGAKIVVLDREGVDWREAYAFLGKVVERMGGRLYTGPDAGTGPEELGVMSAYTRYVTNPGDEGPGQLAECTAEGVFRSIEACLVHRDGATEWSDRSVVVQGLGAVGANLAKRLVGVGASVFGADRDEDTAIDVCERYGLERLDPAQVVETDCDVFAPCAMGGILHDLSLNQLKARVVAGGANNVLAKPLHGDRLHERGVLVAPDFVANSGALLRGTIFHLEGRRESVDRIGKRIGDVVTSVLERASDEGASPSRIAVREADERIDRWRQA